MAVSEPFHIGQLPRTFQAVNSAGAYVDVFTIGATGAITFNTAVTLDVVLSAVLSIAEGGTGSTSAADALVALGLTAVAAEVNYLDITTLGTGAASKALVLDAGDDYTWPATGILTYGVLKDPAGTALDATALELNRACDVSARQVLAGSTLAVTVALHDGKTVLFDQLAGSVCTLPAAAGTGARIRFATSVLATSNSHIVKVTGTDIMVGAITVIDAADDTLTTFATTATSDTITLNRTTTGSVRIGEMIEIEDIKAGFWAVRGVLVGTGGEATPFSATVP